MRAYHVNLSCGLHGADDVVLAGEQKVKYFVLIGCLDFWGEDSPLGSPNSKGKKKKKSFPTEPFWRSCSSLCAWEELGFSPLH